VKAVLHQAGRDPLAGHADVLLAVKDSSETTESELDCGLDGPVGPVGPVGSDGPDGPDGLDGLEGVNELAGLALTAEHADIPKHTRVKAAKRAKDTQRLMIHL